MTESGREQIFAYIPEDARKIIANKFSKIKEGDEFEMIFFSKKERKLNKEKYVSLLKYMRNMAKLKKLQVTQPERTLDISYTSSSLLNANNDDKNQNNENKDNIVFRGSVTGAQNINLFLKRLKDIQNKRYMVYKFILHAMLTKDEQTGKYINFMVKSRRADDTIDLDDLSMRARLSKEEDLTGKLTRNNASKVLDEDLNKLLKNTQIDLETRNNVDRKIVYRLKERTSLYIDDDDDHFIRIDLTDTKTTRDIKTINDTVSNYELEIEYGVKGGKPSKPEHLVKMYSTAESLVKFIQQSPFIIGNTMTDTIIQYYKTVCGIEGNIGNIVARQPVSLEIQHVTEILPNRYSVSDKADGDRYLLIIYNLGVYLINTNLVVKDTGIVLDKKLDKYNGTILDGEYIYIAKERRHVFMVFDCLRNGATDIRGTVSFIQRLDNADEIIDACFVFKGQTGFKYKSPPHQTDDFNINAITEFYGKELSRFYDVLDKDIKVVKEYPLIRRKFFMHIFGALRWEIFNYSVEFWAKYSEDSNVKFPYMLDGLIYHPLEQAYVTNVNESKYHEYKWKPPVKNSMDFYIEFKKDPQTGKILDVYDNSKSLDNLDGTNITDETSAVRNKTYRICTLYVGKTVDGREIPVPFEQNYGVTDAYIYHRDGEIRDISGDIITDKTVVEFYYQNDPSIIPQCRWVPIRTRYDKTESVEKYGRKYGNYSGTAERIWRSIVNPVLMDDFIDLAKGNTNTRNFYDIKIKEMNAKISHQLIVAINKENRYYQKVSKLASTMRDFHNYIKSNLIYTYCNKMYQSNKQQSVLDIACGRGGDIGKFYYTNVDYLVGVDLDSEGFHSPVDGAISRYNAFRRKKPDFPKMYFIQADARALFEYDAQVKAISGMDDVNKKLLMKFFPNHVEGQKRSVFDRINCQFAMHYFLKDQTSWDNFKQNLKNHLRDGGYFIATTFDANEVIKAIGNNEAFTVYYDDSDGNKKKFFEIVRKYGSTDAINVGSAIDVYMSWAFDEGTYQTEFLVDYNFIINDLSKDADLEIVDSDLFSNQLVINKKFLVDATRYESVEDTKKYMTNVAQYYDNSDMNQKCMEYTNLHRYFVFRKRSSADIVTLQKDVKSKKTQKGGKVSNNKTNKKVIDIQERYNFSDMGKFKIPSMINYNDDYSLLNSIHKILVSHSIIPKVVKVDDFVSDMGLTPLKDHEIDEKYIRDITNKVIVNHELTENGKVQNVLNGLNMFFVERDCNNFYDVSYSVKNKVSESDRAIVLMKEGGLYKPIMRKEDKGIRGIVRMNDDMIKDLLDNGESI